MIKTETSFNPSFHVVTKTHTSDNIKRYIDPNSKVSFLPLRVFRFLQLLQLCKNVSPILDRFVKVNFSQRTISDGMKKYLQIHSWLKLMKSHQVLNPFHEIFLDIIKNKNSVKLNHLI